MVTSVEGDGEEEGEVYVGNTVTNQWLFESLREQKGEVRLETLLSYARYFGATCRSDYFYAVRGMWNPSSALLKELRESIKPDYKVPVEDVFTAATYASIVEAGDLNILCLVEDYSLREASGIEEKMNLPSWVPDWSITPIADPLAMNPRPEKGEERWTAGRSLPYSTPLAPIDGHLGVTGVEVSIITSTAEDNEIFGLLEFLSLLSSNPTQAEKIIESFWRTIIKDTYRDQPASESARRAFKGYLSARVYELGEETEGIEELLNEISVRDKSGTMPSWEEVSEVIEKEKGDREFKGVNEEERFFGESVRVACVGRTMFWTGGEEVGELGLGPLETNVGDRVWVLAGMDVPVVLRKVEEGWRFIGECFLGSLVEGIGGRRGEVKDAVLV
ncbi:uncharacterized protein LY89DRAFT_684937 [Mollisia scopiformis]|uniref:Uncharacterized protein n=1 Tax=Mollisia scopiformis TaxID=149040 RepID=A0A194X9Y5_MOLSC|nr:uncharacterized protein LY89DRAFT_684937 [Mollisia scopiformis]KUJ16944.1 hypothetical protein LY89DRAFT_684937 [Mollisia scopiformis]